jgi:hypothetical protein
MAAPASTNFVHKKKLEMLSTAIRDNMPYVRASEQKYPQSELKGKKYGAEVNTYLVDSGTVSDGIEANPDAINERQLTAYMQSKNTSVETDVWNDFNDIESFAKEVLKPRALKLARTIEKDVIDHNVLRGMQAVVKAKVGGVSAPDFELLSDASTKLDELAVPGRKVNFQSPTIYGKIANTGLAKFLPDDIQRDLYRSKYLGEYAGASCVEQVLMPIVKMPSTMDTAPTLTFTPVTETIGGVSTIVGYTVGALTKSDNAKTLNEGAAYTVPGVYLLDESGMETDQPLVVVVHKKITGTTKGVLTESLGIEDLFVTAKGFSTGVPNVWVDPATFDSGSSTTTVTLVALLGASKNYQVGQVRTEDALCFDSYSYSDLPASRTENVGVDGPVTLKCMEFSDGRKGLQMTRIDAPFLSTVWEPRRCVVTYTEV